AGPRQPEHVKPAVAPEVHKAVVGRAKLAAAGEDGRAGPVLRDEQVAIVGDDPERLDPVRRPVVFGCPQERPAASLSPLLLQRLHGLILPWPYPAWTL